MKSNPFMLLTLVGALFAQAPTAVANVAVASASNAILTTPSSATNSIPPTKNTVETNTNQPADSSAVKKVNFSPIFIQLSDAMGAVKAGNQPQAQQIMQQIGQEFDGLDSKPSELGKQARQVINQATANPSLENLTQVSQVLYPFEKEQNPVDYSQKRKDFAKKIIPAYDKFSQALQQADASQLEQLRQAYNEFNAVWLANERLVRNTSMGHYGKIETALALIRVAIESQPINTNQIQSQLTALKSAIDSYNAGDTATAQPAQGVTLASSIQLLQAGLQAFESNDIATGQAKLGEFITVWPMVEGDVSTRNPALYNRVESQIPLVMAHGTDSKLQQTLQQIINELTAINPTAQYTAIDSMLILLREGLEALLIVMSLLSALSVAKQHKGKKWVYAGVVAGLCASIAGAIALQAFFPAITSSSNREMFEGIVGIVAVFMMIAVGAWLHSKSSVQSWNAYIKRHMGEVLTTGSFVSLFGLSFLSVFREGAETILFYVGILPNISMANFLTGIGLALAVLAVVAWVMLKTSVKLPIPMLFKVLTWVIYIIGFKILGVSLHALQLTGYLPLTAIRSIPAIEVIGLYPTVQTVAVQAVYIVILVIINQWMRQSQKNAVLAVN